MQTRNAKLKSMFKVVWKPKPRRESAEQATPIKKQKTEDENAMNTEPTDSRVEAAKELLELVERLGTKMGNLIYYLKKLWETSPNSRIIIFSQVGCCI